MSNKESKESEFSISNSQLEVNEHITDVMSAEFSDLEHHMGFYNGLQDFVTAFKDHFTEVEAKKYYLYHTIIGSTPGAQVTHFDGTGEWSIQQKVEELLERYPIAETL